MKGETAFAIIAVAASLFIAVFLLTFHGACGEEQAVPTPAVPVETPGPAPIQTLETVETTPAPETAADPVVGRWIFDQTYTEELLLQADGSGSLLTTYPTSVNASGPWNVTWTADPGRSGQRMRAYHLTVEDAGVELLFFDENKGDLRRHGEDGIVFYTRAP
ncbi:hypothetical protein E2N92_09545 [Methanofollis formosanus]|uniref:Uncharacterized protein n=1 Tax=Methanofollis formosanus TaxID=299308 RepID=A0A8G1A1W8_9EURY|nr:hypothetical protein [Methanofollis formosanus]QYZ79657.1 hypothetical protein E2N92_09545 [Methanofollis formosanus]